MRAPAEGIRDQLSHLAGTNANPLDEPPREAVFHQELGLLAVLD